MAISVRVSVVSGELACVAGMAILALALPASAVTRRTRPDRIQALASAWSKSASRSSASSSPTLTRMRPSAMPAAARACGVSWR